MFGSKEVKEPDLEFFTIYDSKGKQYRSPMSALNSQVMIRDICNMMRDPGQAKNQLLVNAEDFSLFKIASYDYSSGLMSVFNHEHVANLHDLRAVVQAERVQAEQVGH